MKISKGKLSVFTSLDQRKFRRKNMLFKAEGRKCIEDLLNKFRLRYLVVDSDYGENNKLFLQGVEIYEASHTEIKKISSLATPSGIVGIFEIIEKEITEEELFETYKNKAVILLDGIQDPGNLGTIIRTCDWFGIETIIASKETADIYNPKVVQSTMGSLSRVDVYYADLVKLVGLRKGENVYGTYMNGENVFKTSFDNCSWIVMGNEGNGISEELSKEIKNRITIPPYNKDSHPESLNVGIATAVVLTAFRKD